MNKDKFLKILKRRLRSLPASERQEALDYYSEYLVDGNVEDLGGPEEAANQIIKQFFANNPDFKEKRNGGEIFLIVLLAVFAAPVALPVALAVIAVALAIVIVMFTLVLSVLICGAAFIAGGIAALITGAVIVSADFVNMLMVLGCGLVLIGGGILVLIGAVYAFRALIKFIARLFRRIRRTEDM